MPKEKKDGYAPQENQDERFRTFFTTSVADIPVRMTKEYSDPEPHGLFERLFGRRGKSEDEGERESEPPVAETGEILIGASEEDEPIADLELAQTQEQAAKSFFKKEEEQPQPSAAPAPAKKEEPAQPAAPVTPAPAPEKQASAAPQPEKQAAAPRPPLPQEEQEGQEMAELKALLRRVSAPEEKQTSTPAPAPQPESVPAPQPEKKQAEKRPEAPQTPQTPPQAPEVEPPAPAAEPPAPAAKAVQTVQEEKAPGKAQWFGVGEDEAPASNTGDISLPLTLTETEAEDELPLAGPTQPQTIEEAEEAEAPEEAAAPAESAPEAPGEAAATAGEEESEEAEPEPGTPEAIAERLKQMSASLTLRCVLSGILAAVLLHFGLAAEGLVSPFAGLDPVASRTAFYGVNFVLLILAAVVARSVLRDGLAGLRGTPSAETMPALAACAALWQAFIAFVRVKSYQPSSLTLLSGVAALGLFTALLGDRLRLAAVNEGFALLNAGMEQQGACRARNKDVIRALARDLEQKDPWVLLSRPLDWEQELIDRCFDERAGERRTRKVGYVLLAAAAISGLLFLLFGAGVNGGAAALTGVLCMGAPLSSTLVAGITSLRLQRAAGAVGAMVPGWAAIEELGGIDTIVADAGELFGPECASLEDIRIFKGGRIDEDILYAASILNQGCNTLRGLFNQIIEDRTDILFPVKDLETSRGRGFAAWCGNNRVLLGTRAFMESEGVLLPEPEYEAEHSQNGALQILYLAVSGNLHAMFVLRYKGGRHAARGLEILQRENIRLLVSCEDPSLTAGHIAAAYRLPEGMVTLLDAEQCAEVAANAHELRESPCCMVHLKGFASLTGGLHAAEQAQTAETAATTVQIVSVIFSIFIAALLTSAGSIGSLSVATALMYQAAWSALSIAVCALKQHR